MNMERLFGMKNSQSTHEDTKVGPHNTYNLEDQVLKSIREVQIEIVQEIERICKLENLNYMLMFGTLLGAVRHQGFIPWDDDLDLAMMRKDYDLFAAAFEKHADDKYVLQNVECDPYYAFFFMKVLRKDSTMIEEGYQDERRMNGIFVDIFPMDNAPTNRMAQVIQSKATVFFTSLLLYQVGRMDTNQGNVLVRLVKKFKLGLAKIMSRKSIINISNSIMKLVKQESQCLMNFADLFTYKREQLLDLKPILFEGHLFQAPASTHDVLTSVYGDYMQLPPLDQQVSPHKVIKVVIDGKEIL